MRQQNLLAVSIALCAAACDPRRPGDPADARSLDAALDARFDDALDATDANSAPEARPPCTRLHELVPATALLSNGLFNVVAPRIVARGDGFDVVATAVDTDQGMTLGPLLLARHFTVDATQALLHPTTPITTIATGLSSAAFVASDGETLASCAMGDDAGQLGARLRLLSGTFTARRGALLEGGPGRDCTSLVWSGTEWIAAYRHPLAQPDSYDPLLAHVDADGGTTIEPAFPLMVPMYFGFDSDDVQLAAYGNGIAIAQGDVGGVLYYRFVPRVGPPAASGFVSGFPVLQGPLPCAWPFDPRAAVMVYLQNRFDYMPRLHLELYGEDAQRRGVEYTTQLTSSYPSLAVVALRDGIVVATTEDGTGATASAAVRVGLYGSDLQPLGPELHLPFVQFFTPSSEVAIAASGSIVVVAFTRQQHSNSSRNEVDVQVLECR